MRAFSASAGFSASFLFPLYSFVFPLSFYSHNLLEMRSLGSFIAVGAVVNPYSFLGIGIPAGFLVLSRMQTSGILRLGIHFHSG